MLLFCLSLCISAPVHGPITLSDERTVLQQLWEDYQKYGLPRPPGDARLVRVEELRESNDDERGKVFLVLATKKQAVLKKSEMLAGCEVIRPYSFYRMKVSVVKPDVAALAGTQPMEDHHFDWRRFSSNPDLGLAIQCHALGWDELAAGLLVRHQKHCVPHGRRPQPMELDPRAALARMAWMYWCNQFASDAKDRQAIVEKLHLLVASPYQLNTKLHQNILTDMEAALKPSTAAKDSLEAAIDQLVELKTEDATWLPTSFDSGVHVDDPLCYRLNHWGLESVPTLIRHLDDFRATRSLGQEGYHWNIRIADVMAVRLTQLFGSELRYELLHRDGRGVQIDRRHALALAASLKGKDEKQYLLDHAFTLRRKYDKEKSANTAMLQTLASRYPEEFIRLWREHVGKNDDYASAFATALANSQITPERREELLLEGVKSKNRWWQSNCAQHCLGHPSVPGEMVTWLEALTKKDSMEHVVEVAAKIDDDRVWQAMVKTARRLTVGRRIEILDSVHYSEKLPERRLAFLREFLSDRTLNPLEQDSTEDDESSGGSPFHRGLRVCDVATEKLALLLDVDASPEPSWKVNDWDGLREKVMVALKQHDNRQKEKRP